ncbi:MAG: hypothetical protein MUD01_12285 [Chloroflexaceae bacterium]|jgi:hypothetical protein|nr:hypothetical protein [Chloroflexaceae bacterium]
MSDITNIFPTLLLGLMVVLTLVLLPLLNEDRTPHHDDEPRHDEPAVGGD